MTTSLPTKQIWLINSKAFWEAIHISQKKISPGLGKVKIIQQTLLVQSQPANVDWTEHQLVFNCHVEKQMTSGVSLLSNIGGITT